MEWGAVEAEMGHNGWMRAPHPLLGPSLPSGLGPKGQALGFPATEVWAATFVCL